MTNIAQELYNTSIRMAQGANTVKAKGLITSDTQFRTVYAEVLELMAKSDVLQATPSLSNKRKYEKLHKRIDVLSAEVLDYEKFRMVHK